MHVVPGNGVQIAGQSGDERLALAGLHLGNLPVIQGHAADELHVEVPQAQRAHRRLAHGRERLGQQGIQVLPRLCPLPQRRSERTQLGIRLRLHVRFESVDLLRRGLVVFQLLALAEREQLG